MLQSNRSETLALLQGWERKWEWDSGEVVDMSHHLDKAKLDEFDAWAKQEIDRREEIAASFFPTAFKLLYGRGLDPMVFGFDTLSDLLHSEIFSDIVEFDTVDGDTVGEKETVVRLRKGFDREQSEQGGNATLRFAYTVQRGVGEASFSAGDGTPLVAALEELLSKSKTLERLDLSDNKFNPLARRKLASASARRETAALPACDVEFSRRSEGTGLGAASADRGGEGGGGQRLSLGPPQLMAIGGFDGDVLSQVEVYDSSQRVWRRAASLGGPRCSAAACALGDSRVVLAGGFDGERLLASIELYEPEREAWRRLRLRLPAAYAQIRFQQLRPTARLTRYGYPT